MIAKYRSPTNAMTAAEFITSGERPRAPELLRGVAAVDEIAFRQAHGRQLGRGTIGIRRYNGPPLSRRTIMAYISYADARPLDPDLAELYDQVCGRLDDFVPNILRIQASNPASLEAHLDLHHTLMLGPSSLSRTQREMIGVVVSQINECHYGLQHHGAALRQLVKDDAFVARLESDFQGVDLVLADRAMLDYAAKLTRAPREVTRADVDGLRAVGFADAAILDICLVTAYFSFANRIAHGLGIELETHWRQRVRLGDPPP
jgi:uncharacterized peroxidase-related enzyme